MMEDFQIYSKKNDGKEFWNSAKLMKLNINESIEENKKFQIIRDHLNLRRLWSWKELKTEKKKA